MPSLAVETRKQHGFEVSAKVANKNWWAKISKLPAQQLDHFETKFHIDGGFLYYDDAARGYRLCVPSGHSPIRTVKNNIIGSRKGIERTNDQTASVYDDDGAWRF